MHTKQEYLPHLEPKNANAPLMQQSRQSLLNQLWQLHTNKMEQK